MRWPWSGKQPTADAVPDDTQEATRARERAEAALRAAKQQTGEIKAVAERSMHHQRVNHFAQLISETFWGTR